MPHPPKSGPHAYLRRYTHLPAALHMLRRGVIALLDPMSWDDSNDSHYINEYKRQKGLKTVLAACLSSSPETYHQWKVFAGNPSGVCIRFRQGLLLRAAKKVEGVTVGRVQYRTVREARRQTLPLEEFPFIKRAAFVDEEEVRIMYQSRTESLALFELPIPLKCVSRLTLSPWLPKNLVSATKERIRSIEGCEFIEVVRSTIVNNEEWKRFVQNAA